ncbi:AMP-binding protein [Candidatus Thiosymbion oneisti]|uniref:AMP-binding protein n=1 Tax=Candidatus Thiosymbion oneisti TaxID=589554 RepID=UPI000A53E36B|nr:AMP-binding protein [Candidatus Thiosymbion oneisti]
MNQCIHHLLDIWARQSPDAIAIEAPNRIPLTYRRLRSQIDDVVKTLNAMDLGRNDRIAIVLPNGPEMAVAFLAVAAGATSVPLNPAYRDSEFGFYLSDLGAKALMIHSEIDAPARTVARALGIPIIELIPVLTEGAGIFTLTGNEHSYSVGNDFAQPDDVALVLHTSGTTSRPKIVPLTQINLCVSAHNIKVALELVDSDRCINVMPLFHIHGLIGAILSSLFAGASVVCAPGFYASKFFAWLEEFRPTWYTAVPTMHQAILECASSNHDVVEHCPLRFIRSSSSPLPPKIMVELENIFKVPVIESYGMTEASHQMTSNPLPPRKRKPGSVGMAAGPEVTIVNEAGDLLSPGEIGETIIRGANVTRGYENNPAANKSAFTNGWFRTGDQGYLDTDGYLFITGRIKEIINRGGEKITPREVDEALMDHPAVGQAVTFAVPHATLGEDVAAAVVLREGASATEKEIREFAFTRLADYKIPSRILIVGEIPKGPTGKLQRIGLAEKLAAKLKPEYIAPGNQIENTLARIWAEILDIEQVGINDNFFALGGESLSAARVLSRIRTDFQVELPLRCLFEFPTIAGLAQHIETEQERNFRTCQAGSRGWSSLIPIQSSGSKKPFFLIPGGGGGEDEFMIYAKLLYLVGQNQPIYGFRARGLDGQQAPHTEVEAMAADYVKEIRAVQPKGPYLLGGECTGGVVAFEMAQQLQAQGHKVALLALMNTGCPGEIQGSTYLVHKVYGFLQLSRIRYHWWKLSQFEPKEQLFYIFDIVSKAMRIISSVFRDNSHARHIEYVRREYPKTISRYRPIPYSGRVALLVSEDHYDKRPTMGWDNLVAGGLKIHKLAGNRYSYLGEHVRTTAKQLRVCLDEAHKM